MGEAVGVAVGLGVAVALGVGLGVGLGVALGVGDGLELGVARFQAVRNARAASMRPLETPRTLTVELSSVRSIAARDIPGSRLFISAAMPATTGVAKDVPHHHVHAGPGLPVRAQPGAESLTHDPRLDQLYMRSELFVAPTLITPGSAAG